MEVFVDFYTDVATIAIFDPERLNPHAGDDADWWAEEFVPEVVAGAAAIVGTGRDGSYRLRFTDGDLTEDEEDYAVAWARLGVEVVSERLYIGPGESIPGGGSTMSAEGDDRGEMFTLPNGEYDLYLYAVHWFESGRWWYETGGVPDDAPCDFVVAIRPRTEPFVPPDTAPRLVMSGEFIFESETRQVGPVLDMLLTTDVRKAEDGSPTLGACGPLSYRPALVDYSPVAEGETIRFRVVSIDHDSRTMIGEFVEKVLGSE